MKPAQRIPIPEEAVLYLERCHFSKAGLQNLLTQFTYQSEFPIDEARYDQLLGEYLEAFAELELVLHRVLHAYVAPEFLDAAYYTQEVDFLSKEVLVYEKGATDATNCRTCHH